jgi:hypothetical protein
MRAAAGTRDHVAGVWDDQVRSGLEVALNDAEVVGLRIASSDSACELGGLGVGFAARSGGHLVYRWRVALRCVTTGFRFCRTDSGCRLWFRGVVEDGRIRLVRATPSSAGI